MAGTQTTIQQLIQQLTPSGVNNGNPNTAYNNPLPPMQNAQGQWFTNAIGSAASLDPRTLNLPPMQGANVGPGWQAPAGLQARLPVWPTPFDPAQYALPPQAPVTPPTGVPATTPLPAPVLPPNGAVVRPGGGDYIDAMGGGCVVVGSHLEDYDRADDVQFGDTMIVIDPVTFKRSTGEVSYSETKLMPCVRITTESGIELECSRTAPIADEQGNQVLAPDLLNKLIPVQDNGMNYLDRVASIEDIGEQEVRHITVENNFFLAGKQKGRYVFHHNMKMVDGLGMDFRSMYDSRDAGFGWGMDTGGFGAESMGTMKGNFRPGSSNYAPTGQGLIDAFGVAPAAPAIATAPNPWSPLTAEPYNANWFQDQQMYNNSLNIPSLAPQQEAGGGVLATLGNWVDDNLLGDSFNQDTNSMNWGNAFFSGLEAVTGIPVNSVRLNTSMTNLMTGSGDGSYAANQYNRASPEQQQRMVAEAAKENNLTPAQAEARFLGQ